MDHEEERDDLGILRHPARKIGHHFAVLITERLQGIFLGTKRLGPPHQRNIAQRRTFAKVRDFEVQALRTGFSIAVVKHRRLEHVLPRPGDEMPLQGDHFGPRLVHRLERPVPREILAEVFDDFARLILDLRHNRQMGGK